MSFLKKIFGSSSAAEEKPSIVEQIIEPPKTPEEIAKQWRRDLAREARRTDAQVQKIKQEEKKITIEMKKAAKMGDQYALKTLAKNVLHSRKACKQLMTAKAQMNSVSMQLQHQLATMKMMGVMSKSTEIMQGMNQLVNITEVRETMMTMSKEMMKAGLIDEMMDETIEDALGDVEEDELDEEVDKVIADVMTDKLKGTRVVGGRLPQKQAAVEDEVEEEEAVEENEDELMAKYNALKTK